jgi:hypothetical protein
LGHDLVMTLWMQHIHVFSFVYIVGQDFAYTSEFHLHVIKSFICMS